MHLFRQNTEILSKTSVWVRWEINELNNSHHQLYMPTYIYLKLDQWIKTKLKPPF